MKTFKIKWEFICRGTTKIEAESQEDAEQLINKMMEEDSESVLKNTADTEFNIMGDEDDHENN